VLHVFTHMQCCTCCTCSHTCGVARAARVHTQAVLHVLHPHILYAAWSAPRGWLSDLIIISARVAHMSCSTRYSASLSRRTSLPAPLDIPPERPVLPPAMRGPPCAVSTQARAGRDGDYHCGPGRAGPPSSGTGPRSDALWGRQLEGGSFRRFHCTKNRAGARAAAAAAHPGAQPDGGFSSRGGSSGRWSACLRRGRSVIRR
jgi:hypothetical protein